MEVPVLVKTGLTSLDLLALVKELESALISARLENVYQLEGGSLFIRFHGTSGQSTLIVEPSSRLNLTRFKYSVPERPSPIASQLRHFLSSSKVESLGQVDFDRILYIELLRGGERMRVYFELFGDGNVVVVAGDGMIKYALHYRQMRDRSVKQGLQYVPPPPRGMEDLRTVAVDEVKSQKFNLSRALTRLYNLPSEVVEEALSRASLDPNSPAQGATPESLEAFLGAVRSIVEDVTACKLRPNIVMKDGSPSDVLPLEFVSLGPDKKYFESFNEAVDDYFSAQSLEKMKAGRRSPAEGSLRNLESIMERQRLHIKELEDMRKENNEMGIAIMSNLAAVQETIDSVRNLRRSGADWNTVLKSGTKVKVDDIDTNRGTMKITLNGREQDVDFKVSASENAQRFFSESKDALRKLEGLKEALKESEKKIETARQGLQTIVAPVLLKAMKKEWYERFRWMLSPQGFLIIGGRDSTQNEVLVKRHMEPNDLFVHSDVPGGSVVIIKTQGRDVPYETEKQAVALAVAYSRAWGAGLGVADGYWVKADQVSKSPPSGEYIGKGAFMVYGERNYVRNVPLALFLAIRISGDGFKIFISAGDEVIPADPHVKLVPGDAYGPELIKKIREVLSQKLGEDNAGLMRSIPPQDIEMHLPKGGCSIAG